MNWLNFPHVSPPTSWTTLARITHSGTFEKINFTLSALSRPRRKQTYQRPRARESWDAARAQSRMNDCQLPEFDPNGFPVSALRAFKSTLVTALFRCRLDF
jgi:hypothetical protein